MTTKNTESTDTPAVSELSSSDLLEVSSRLAAAAPSVPGWFKAKQDESLDAAREIYFIIKNKREVRCGMVEELKERAGIYAKDSVWNATRGFKFPFEDDFQFERQVQWIWYYAVEVMKRRKIYFPNKGESYEC